ncbi:type II secretion system F family protein [Jannaschia sp. R86511]|uniref:type II secretion system F family protein n=1 Tax=Jannaschia sp. R86511 TaxID=3093853 RepID=UPI0036D3B2A8
MTATRSAAVGPGSWTVRLVLALLVLVVPAVAAGGRAPAGAATVEPSSGETIVRIADIRSADGALQFVVTTSGLPPETDLGAADVSVAFRPDTGDAVPLRTTEEAVPEQVRRQTAVLAVDASGSLGDEGLDDVRDAVDVFLDTVPDEVEVGLVTFEAPPVVRVRPTTDRDAVRDELAGLEAEGATGLYDAVVAATGLLPGEGSERVVVLSDGRDEGLEGGTPGSVVDLQTAVAAVQASGAELTAIGFRDGAPREALQALADAGQGQLVDAAQGDDLDDAFDVAATNFTTELDVTAQVPPELAGSRGNIELTLGLDPPISTRAYYTLPGVGGGASAPPSPEPSEAVASPLRSVPGVSVRWGGPVVWAGLAGFFLAVGTVVVLLLTLGARRERPEDQRRRQLSLYTLGGPRRGAAEPASGPRTTRLGDNAVARSAVQLADRVVDRGGGLTTLSRRLEVADIPLRPAEWVVLQVSAAVAVGLLLLLVGGGNPLLGLVGLVLGAVALPVYLSVRETRRRREFLRLLPETLGLVASGLRAGYSVPQSLEAVVQEGQEPMRAEFNRALVEVRLGVAIDDALEGVAARMRSQDFRWVVMAMRIHREVGGNLSEILDTVGATLRERSRLRRQVDVLSAEGRLSAWIIGLLPVVFSFYLLLTRPEYLRPLYTEPLGVLLLVVGVVLFVVGVLGLRWAVKVEV